MKHYLNKWSNWNKKTTTAESFVEDIFLNFSKDADLVLRHQEMTYLFSKKPYSEWLVISTNRNRAYIRAKSFKLLSEDKQNELLKSCEKKFPIFCSCLHIENFEWEIFITLEPLISGKIEKEEAKKLTDFVDEYLDTEDYI